MGTELRTLKIQPKWTFGLTIHNENTDGRLKLTELAKTKWDIRDF